MGMFDDIEGIVKRQMVLFFVVDTSGSMQGTKIGAVNTAIREVLPELKDALVPNCQYLLWCPESKGCGAYPTKEKLKERISHA